MKSLKHRIGYFSLLLLSAFILTACMGGKGKKEDSAHHLVADPLPGDLVKQILLEDSLYSSSKDKIMEGMLTVVAGYKRSGSNKGLSSYFLTDLDHDSIPELWVKTATNEDDAKLELYFPTPDGGLKRSSSYAGIGKFYEGPGYLIQAASNKQGYFTINRITIDRGSMDIQEMETFDLYAHPEIKSKTFSEPLVKEYSFNNLTPIKTAFTP